jgi:hypothetical protein
MIAGMSGAAVYRSVVIEHAYGSRRDGDNANRHDHTGE